MKGKDFVRREAALAAKLDFNASTQANSAQSPYFRGQINADRTKITDTNTNKEYNLSFTGNPREFEYAVAISDSEAIVNAQTSKFVPHVDGNTELDYFFSYYAADEQGFPISDALGNYSYTINKLSKDNIVKTASNFVPLQDLTVTSSLTNPDGSIGENSASFENITYSQDGRHLIVYRVGYVSTLTNTGFFSGTVVEPVNSICTPPAPLGVNSCIIGVDLIPVVQVVQTSSETFASFLSYKLFKNFNVTKINGVFSFTYSSTVTEIDIELPPDSSAIGLIDRSVSLHGTPPNPYVVAGTTSQSFRGIEWFNLDFSLDNEGLPIMYLNGMSSVGSEVDEIWARPLVPLRDLSPPDPTRPDYLIGGDCAIIVETPQGPTGWCSNDSTPPPVGPGGPGYVKYFLPEGLYDPDFLLVELSRFQSSFAVAFLKITNLRQTELVFHAPPFQTGIPADTGAGLIGGIIIGTHFGTHYTANGFIANDDYFITCYGNSNAANAGAGQQYDIIGLISFKQGLLESQSQNYPVAEFPLPSDQYCFCDNSRLYLGVYPPNIYIAPEVNSAIEVIYYQAPSKLHIYGKDAEASQLNFYVYSKKVTETGEIEFIQKSKDNRTFPYTDFRQANLNGSVVRGG